MNNGMARRHWGAMMREADCRCQPLAAWTMHQCGIKEQSMQLSALHSGGRPHKRIARSVVGASGGIQLRAVARIFGVALRVDTIEFWFMMQIAMIFGFVTTYPVNWWLIRLGIKERM